MQMLNLGLIVTEVVRALTGSIGLICTIPFTAAITAWFFSMEKSGQKPLPKAVTETKEPV